MHANVNQTKQFLNLNQTIFFTKPRPIYKTKPKHSFNQNQSLLHEGLFYYHHFQIALLTQIKRSCLNKTKTL